MGKDFSIFGGTNNFTYFFFWSGNFDSSTDSYCIIPQTSNRHLDESLGLFVCNQSGCLTKVRRFFFRKRDEYSRAPTFSAPHVYEVVTSRHFSIFLGITLIISVARLSLVYEAAILHILLLMSGHHFCPVHFTFATSFFCSVSSFHSYFIFTSFQVGWNRFSTPWVILVEKKPYLFEDLVLFTTFSRLVTVSRRVMRIFPRVTSCFVIFLRHA